MLTESGTLLAAGLALCLVGLIGIVVTVRQYLHRGPLLSAVYFAAPKEEREKLKTQKAYRYAGNLFLVLTTVCWLFGLSLAFDEEALAFIGAGIVLGEACAGFMFLAVQDRD